MLVFSFSAIFKSLTSDLDDITMTVGGGVKLQLVFGDITNEITEVVVNTTNFVNFQNGGWELLYTTERPRYDIFGHFSGFRLMTLF